MDKSRRLSLTQELAFNSNSLGSRTITGAFRILSTQSLQEIMSQCLDSKTTNNSEIFYTGLSVHDKTIAQFDLLEDFEWIDIGHLDTYFNAKRMQISASARKFNNILYERESNTLKKLDQ